MHKAPPIRVQHLAVACIAALALAACGGNGDTTATDGSASSGSSSVGKPSSDQHRGGTLKVLSNESFEHLDPGSAYYQLDYEVVYAVHRPLYSYKPDDSKTLVPDLAADEPQISADGKTVTVKIKPDVEFGPPLDRDVTSADVKYAFERGMNPSVANGYEQTYFGDVVGLAKAKGGPIPGITTPDAHTIVFHLTKPVGATVAQALSMPLSAPVPKEIAGPLDKRQPSGYDSDPTKQVATGPYMIKAASPGKSLTLVRNPHWSASTDFRPAYVNRIDWTLGVDPAVEGRQILTGSNMINGDTPTAATVKLAVTKHPDQVSFTPYGNRYVTLNTSKPPFDDIDLRKAVSAQLDRTAMQLTRGGKIAGDIATHYLPPTIPGFAEAGGMKGPGFDFLAHPSGDPELAASYMKKAGFPSGKYSGPKITMVGDNSDPAAKTTLVILDALEQLGFKVKLVSVGPNAFYSKFCQVTAAMKKIDVCANFGWLPDFSDPLPMLKPTFSGESIVPVGNVNPSLLDDPKINREMDRATEISGKEARAEAWGKIDRDVTATAAGIPWFWDKQPNVQSENVHGVIATWNAVWDLSYTSIR